MKSKVILYQRKTEDQHNFHLEIHDSVWQPLLKNPNLGLGVRPIVRQFEQEVNDAISRAHNDKVTKRGERLFVFRENKKIKLRLIRE